MIGLVASRLAQIALTLAALSFVAFLLIGLMPGDPIALAIAGDPRLTAEDALRLRALHGLDTPILDRYAAWAASVLAGEFGHSRLFARPVANLLWPALGATLLLLGVAVLLAAGAGLLLGALAATRRRARGAVDALAILAASAPTFWIGILLIIAFAVTLGWLPAGGQSDDGGLDGLRFLVLPVATLAIAGLASWARHAASALTDVLSAPWIVTARARGASRHRVLWLHALPNAAPPLVTLAALDAGALVGGALVTETVFARPGMGKLLYDAVMGSDLNLALIALLLIGGVTMAATLAADLALRALDPRLGDAR